MSFIGIDLGTSFIKGAVLDLDGLQIRHIQRVPFPAPQSGRPALYLEFDPAEILAAVHTLLATLLPLADDCQGIAICGLMHGLVFADECGRPHSSLTTWQDQRVLEPHPSGLGTYFDALAIRLTADERRQLGNELRPGLPVSVLFWLAERGELPEPHLVPASLPDFVVGNLCETTPTTETTNGMAHGALNLETMDWHYGVIARLGLAGLAWPAVRPQGTVAGRLNWGGRAIPIYTPAGDFQVSLAGALIQPGELSLNISTGSQVSTLLPDLGFGDFQTRPFFDGRFLATVTHIPAGRALNALVRLFSELAAAEGLVLRDPWGYIARAAAEARPPHLHANLAFFSSAFGDHGALTGLREEELTVGHLFRAAFENMADNYDAAARRVARGQPWRGLVFSGGLVRKLDVLRELICARFASPFRLCPSAEDTMLGLLALALAFTRRTATVAEAMQLLLAAYRDETDPAGSQAGPAGEG
ncbi:MAG TPA: FGGY family carbohydrate kinase [Anaerolineae bacterium]